MKRSASVRLAYRVLIVVVSLALAATLFLALAAVTFPLRHEAAIHQWASIHGQLDPQLVAAMIHAESRFRETATSPVGAQGLMQIMPATGAWIAQQIGIEGPVDLSDPGTSIRFGTWYLSYLLDRYDGDLEVALAAYNAGPTTVDRWASDGTPPYEETSTYISRVLSRRRIYALLYGTPILGSLLRAVLTLL